MDTTDTTPVTAVAPTDSTAMNVTTVVARAKEKGMSLKEFSAKANVNLGSVYNALRAHKEGKVIYSAKFIAALEKALTD